jgi:NADH dehydrogenase
MNITIVGGGFGGVKAALELAKIKKNHITLITDKVDFQYYPALYGAATGQSHLESWVPLEQIFRHHINVTVVIDKITAIIRESAELVGESGMKYSYHTLIIAIGTVTTFFGIEGLDTYAYGIKSEVEIQKLKQHLHTEFALERKADKHYVVIGGGPTGVELASALGSYLEKLRIHYGLKDTKIKVDLVEAAPRVLPRMSEETSAVVLKRLTHLGVNVETGKSVESATASGLQISGVPIESHTIIWTSGMSNHPLLIAEGSGFILAKNGKVIVDEYLRAEKNIYVIGDNAATAYSGLAQTALKDGIYVAKAIMSFHVHRTPKPYKAIMPPVVVPVGENWAVFEWKFIKIHGWVASIVRMLADVVGYSDILPFGQALGVWRSRRIKNDMFFKPEKATSDTPPTN